MSLNDFSFLVGFFSLLIVLLVLQAVRKKFGKADKLQLLVLLIFSYEFICCAELAFGLCVAVITIIAYVAGRLLDKYPGSRLILCGGVWAAL